MTRETVNVKTKKRKKKTREQQSNDTDGKQSNICCVWGTDNQLWLNFKCTKFTDDRLSERLVSKRVPQTKEIISPGKNENFIIVQMCILLLLLEHSK